MKKVSKYKNIDETYSCECGRIFFHYNGLNGHFRKCETHRNFIGKGDLPIYSHKGTNYWNKSKEEKSEISKKSAETLRKNISNGIREPRKYHSLSKEHKQKISISTKKYLKNTIKCGGDRYSIKACNFINDLNKKYCFNFQHAENGGEITVGPYYMDAYDKINNICFEYNEYKHHVDKQKENKKLSYIKHKLNCRIFIYEESEKLIYEFIDDARMMELVDMTELKSVAI